MSKLPELNDRAQRLLKILVERYIQDGQPVGSRVLSREAGLNLSPATIRNVMADLEDMGLVTSPHTSAGRVPTVTGYRLFIDSLLTVRPLDVSQVQKLREDLDTREDSGQLLETASRLLSDLSQMAGVVTLPRTEPKSFRHIEFLPLSGGRILVILVTNEHEVRNKIICPSRHFSASQLEQAANYLNTVFQGKDLNEVRRFLLQDLSDTRERVNQEMLQAVAMAGLAFKGGKDREDFFISGETNLMEFSELSDLERLRRLFEAFDQKRGILHLLDQSMEADGVHIYIGEESGYDALGLCSVVTSPYCVEGEIVGVVGVIGPTRMEYERVIPLVDVTAKLLGVALNQNGSPSS